MKDKSYSFPKSEKLCRLKLIQTLFSEGKSVQSYPLKMVFIPANYPEDVQFQLLISVPKRIFKKAVHRNRVKRLIRESYRLQKHFLQQITPQKHALALIFIGKELLEYDLIFKSTKRCFEKFAEANDVLNSEN